MSDALRASAHRTLFYVDALPEVGELAVVDGDEGFHAANVRRIRPGEELDLGDGDGTVAHCVVEDVAKGRLSARVLDRRTVPAAAPAVTVVQALPKSDRSELAIELATEAGADAFIAWQASRCVARWDGRSSVNKGLRRWGAVARSATRQSRRPYIPPVTGVVSTTRGISRSGCVTTARRRGSCCTSQPATQTGRSTAGGIGPSAYASTDCGGGCVACQKPPATLLGRWFWWLMNGRTRPARPQPVRQVPAEVGAGYALGCVAARR